ncbi:hypothetical protein F5882DRAFT_403242 [Hyaloscypha sp. PMI_1271]|nr:hypothetical protein F5882DRAFT_403242 [Hyaloscypha sp. PMI_1271]
MCQFEEPASAPLASVRRRSWRRPVCAVFLSIHAMLAGVSHRMASQKAKKGGADQESCSVSARPKGSVLSSYWLLFFVSVLVWELLAAHHYHGHAIALHQESAPLA